MGWPGPMTERTFQAWIAWQELELNRPSRMEWYLMAIAAEIRRSYVDHKKHQVKIEDMKLQFTPGYEEREGASSKEEHNKEVANAYAKMRSFGRLGGNFRVRLPDGSLVDAKDYAGA